MVGLFFAKVEMGVGITTKAKLALGEPLRNAV
jgi:hypothetical protein